MNNLSNLSQMNQHAQAGLGGLYQQPIQQGIAQYDPNPQLTKALNRLAKALEDLKPRVRVKMGCAVV